MFIINFFYEPKVIVFNPTSFSAVNLLSDTPCHENEAIGYVIFLYIIN